MHTLLNIFYLGIKELRSLGRDTMMLIIITFAFSGQIYVVATGIPESLHKAPIAIVDEDRSQLSQRIVNAFYSPRFLVPAIIDPSATDSGMDVGSTPSSSTSRPISSGTSWPGTNRRSRSTSTPRV